MDGEQKPMFLLADSQLLFPRAGQARLLDRVKATLDGPPVRAKAAYLGASNGDAPEFYEVFVAAMSGIGVKNCKHVRAEPDASERAFLAEADIILLAGGCVVLGWSAFEAAGLVEVLRSAPSRGATLIGVSAGAVQMGMIASGPDDTTLPLLSFLPYAIGAHDEPEWGELVKVVRHGGGHVVGLGIPMGGAVISHPHRSIEPFRKPFTEVVWSGDNVKVTYVLVAPPPANPLANEV